MTRPTTTPLPPPRIYPSLTTIIRHLKTQFKFLPHSSTTPTPHQITTICGHQCPRSKRNQGPIERYGDMVPTTRKSSFGSQWMDGGFAKSPTTTKSTGASHSRSYPTQTPSTTRTDLLPCHGIPVSPDRELLGCSKGGRTAICLSPTRAFVFCLAYPTRRGPSYFVSHPLVVIDDLAYPLTPVLSTARLGTCASFN